MMPDKSKSLPFYEGVDHAAEDIRRKWRGTNVLFIDGDGNMFPVLITDFSDNGRVYFTNTIKNTQHSVPTEHFYVAREFPINGVFGVGSGVYQLSRRQDRQWKRGTNPETTVIDVLMPPERGLEYDTLVAHAFLFKPITFEEGIKTVKPHEPKVISRHMWLSARDGVLASLFYDDVFVGYVDKDRNFISHSESITLAEEAVNELGLHPV